MAAVCLHHTVLRRPLGILDQQTTGRPLHKTDEQDQTNNQRNHCEDRQPVDRARATALKQLGKEARHLRDNTSHDDQ